jgi:Cupin-like domain
MSPRFSAPKLPRKPASRLRREGREAFALGGGVLVAALYGGWQLVAEQKLFLHTLLVERTGNRRVARLPLGYRNVLQLKLIMLRQQLSGDPEALKHRQFEVYARIRRRLDERGVPPGRVATIREYEAAALDPRVFYKKHVRRAVPCVIRGFYDGDLARFRLKALARRFPGTVAQAFDRDDETIKSVQLRDISTDGGARYVPQQALLDQDPRLLELFELHRTRRFFPILGRPSRPVASFLIIGSGRGLNANFHCEESPNWYMAVSGSKRWTLVEAEHSWLMYPAGRGDGMRRFSEFQPAEDGTPRDATRFPLFDYAPKLEFDLHPGDVLFFPAWMWHKTVNLDEEGLGVTCRYAPPAPMSNRYFRGLQLISPAYWRSTVQVVAGKLRGDTGGLEDAGGFNTQEVALIADARGAGG